MSFEAVLGNTEFELVVLGVTFAVVPRRSTSGHDVSVLNYTLISPIIRDRTPDTNE
jgi:hypothetical protein